MRRRHCIFQLSCPTRSMPPTLGSTSGENACKRGATHESAHEQLSNDATSVPRPEVNVCFPRLAVIFARNYRNKGDKNRLSLAWSNRAKDNFRKKFRLHPSSGFTHRNHCLGIRNPDVVNGVWIAVFAFPICGGRWTDLIAIDGDQSK